MFFDDVTPSRLKCSVRNSELVSTREGVSSSLPTAMISARFIATEETSRLGRCRGGIENSA